MHDGRDECIIAMSIGACSDTIYFLRGTKGIARGIRNNRHARCIFDNDRSAVRTAPHGLTSASPPRLWPMRLVGSRLDAKRGPDGYDDDNTRPLISAVATDRPRKPAFPDQRAGRILPASPCHSGPSRKSLAAVSSSMDGWRSAASPIVVEHRMGEVNRERANSGC